MKIIENEDLKLKVSYFKKFFKFSNPKSPINMIDNITFQAIDRIIATHRNHFCETRINAIEHSTMISPSLLSFSSWQTMSRAR